MEELLSKPWWESIGVITGVLLSIIAILIKFWQNKKKKISYSIRYLASIIELDKKTVLEDIELYHKGSLVCNPFFAEIEIKNTGNISISKEDFEDSILIEIENCKRIVSAKIIQVSPKNISANLNVGEYLNKIKLNPMLMNPKDFIRIRVIFEGENSVIKIFARIIGISAIANDDYSLEEKYMNKIFMVGLIGSFVSILLFKYEEIFTLIKEGGNWGHFLWSEILPFIWGGMAALATAFFALENGLLKEA